MATAAILFTPVIAPSKFDRVLARPFFRQQTSIARRSSYANSANRLKFLPSSSPSPSSGPSEDDGVVQDMERYLNDLSLEYESVWDTKPAWCQPWTILLTGFSAAAFSWLLLHSVAITTVACLVIAAWWYVFLYSYPQAYIEMIAERRRRVKAGDEDTYGFKLSEK